MRFGLRNAPSQNERPISMESAKCRTISGGRKTIPPPNAQTRTPIDHAAGNAVSQCGPQCGMGGFGSPGFDVERNVEDAQRLLAARGTEAGDAFRSLRAVREGNVFAIDANRYFARPSPSLAVRRLVSLPFPPC